MNTSFSFHLLWAKPTPWTYSYNCLGRMKKSVYVGTDITKRNIKNKQSRNREGTCIFLLLLQWHSQYLLWAWGERGRPVTPWINLFPQHALAEGSLNLPLPPQPTSLRYAMCLLSAGIYLRVDAYQIHILVMSLRCNMRVLRVNKFYRMAT